MHECFGNFGHGCGCGHDIAAPTMPLIGDPAPSFTAMTTNGPVSFPADYAGKWVILFSHPSDFTPVCTSEFMAFQDMYSDFQQLNTEIIGVSVGSLSSHLAWLRAIEDIDWRSGPGMKITFPVIDDLSKSVATRYGMIHPNASDTKAVRAVFIIDPKGIIRAIFYYPASTGRNFDEIMRTLIALQTSDGFGVSTPADWLPGEDVLVSAPATADGMRDMAQNKDKKLDVKSWFLIFRPLPADTISTKLQKSNRPKSDPKKKRK